MVDVQPPPCAAFWGDGCSAREWGHECILPQDHPIDHLCVCKARIACNCICHVPGSKLTSHHRPCCINWVGGFWGKVGDAYPLIQARTQRDTVRQAAALLRRVAEGRREYAADAPDEMRAALLCEADAYDTAAKIAEGDVGAVLALIPSWQWTEAEERAVRLEPPAGGGRR
jgi:hypothetical protein